MNQYDLKSRVAVVTGAARGIGQAIAARMLDSGAEIAIWDVDEKQMLATTAALKAKGKVTAHQVDLVDEQAVNDALERTIEQHGKIDILVNNAGITGGNAVTWELDPEVFRRVVDVNLVAPFLACKAIVPHMLEKGYGRIVNIASIAGKEGNPTASHYSSSKAGLIALTKSIGKELATKNILVNCITPAAAHTDIFGQMKPEHIQYMLSKIPMGRFVNVDEIAAMACWLSSEECSFSTGGVFDISGGRAVY